MQQVRKKSKELDHYLKSVISGVPRKLDSFIEGSDKSMTYYTGNWATDVAANFTEKQSEKIFKKMAKIMAKNPNVMFVQKRMKPIEVGTWSEYGEQEAHSILGYEYYAIKR